MYTENSCASTVEELEGFCVVPLPRTPKDCSSSLDLKEFLKFVGLGSHKIEPVIHLGF